MGLALTRLIRERPRFALVGAATAADDPACGRDLGELAGQGALGVTLSADLGSALLGADVAIDFSAPGAVPRLAAAAASGGVALVSGTTGLPEAARAALERASARIPVLWAPNTSLGVQVLAELVTAAVRQLGEAFDVEIVEVHHGRKTDAPSGTALRLAEAARLARPALAERHGRSGAVGARGHDELGVLAVRGGDVIGDHTVHLLGAGERLELTHRATSRDVFALGALRAAEFVVGRPPALYTLRDLLA
ncbi:MAG: 4-hydroxy-tetrahydrodipicolinate reductase [Polyangiaceae bacterium]|nr:4-hydroxy-tetrahydrodipicolinate reductase [Polyangiaceae bacterium]